MVELKEKTVKELRKIASKKKVEGRSKMNKADLVKALKKSIKKRKMNGGGLTEDQIQMLLYRNYQENPMFLRNRNKNGTLNPEEQIVQVVRGDGYNTNMIYVITDKDNNSESFCTINHFTISDDGNTLIYDFFTEERAHPQPPRYSSSPPPRYSAPRIPSNVYSAYVILGVEPGADFKTVVKPAYRALVVKVHPNKGGSAEQFRPIQKAYKEIEKYEKTRS